MQYVRTISGSVSGAWNAINPANLSGAIDVIVVEQEDGTLACSPFHVRFGKFSLLRPFEKKVEFKVNDVKQEHSMKLGEGGDAFFVFETSENVPEGLQTSPLISPASSPDPLMVKDKSQDVLQEPEYLDISADPRRRSRPTSAVYAGDEHPLVAPQRAASDLGNLTPLSSSPSEHHLASTEWLKPSPMPLRRPMTDDALPTHRGRERSSTLNGLLDDPAAPLPGHSSSRSITDARSRSPPPLSNKDAFDRALALSKKLEGSNIPSRVMESGDLMLDMQGYKANEEDALRAEVIARQLLAEELQGDYDVGAIMGADEEGNLWIYSSEEAKEAAKRRKDSFAQSATDMNMNMDAASDPGFNMEDDEVDVVAEASRTVSERPQVGLVTPPHTPPGRGTAGDPNKNYVKTLRLTSDQLKSMNLRAGPNKMTFTVARATCTAWLFYWSYKVPLVVSDIDGTITKSDALGQVLNMIGRDWTHAGVAKLYTDIVANGYNVFYLSSRSVGQADTTRAYLNGVIQEGYKLPHGPVILSPDRTLAALRREVYLRKPEIFKMQCLRDILNLYSSGSSKPFYAGFGNRFTDAVSYRSVGIPSSRIFTINSNAEVSLDLINFTKYKASYTSIREVVDHYFPPVGLLNQGEEYTDFAYWREKPRDIIDFSASEDEDEDADEDEEDDDDFSPGPARGRAIISSRVRKGRVVEEPLELEDEDEEEEDDEDDNYMEGSFLSEGEEPETPMFESMEERFLSPRASIDTSAAVSDEEEDDDDQQDPVVEEGDQEEEEEEDDDDDDQKEAELQRTPRRRR